FVLARTTGALEKAEVEVALYHRRHHRQPPRPGAQPLDLRGEHLTHALGQRGRAGLEGLPLKERPEGFHDHEGIALARRPHALAEARQRAAATLAAGPPVAEAARLRP